MSKLKLFIAYYQGNNFIPACDIIQPIQVGAQFATKHFSNMLQDNVGENISEKNAMYCELTAQYWAWKNIDCEYYGFFHYRRYLSFNQNLKDEPDNWNIVVRDYLNQSAVEDLHIDTSHMQLIEEQIQQYDAVSMRPIDLKKACGLTVYEQYEKDGIKLHIEDIDTMLDIIKTRHSEFYDIAMEYMHGYRSYVGNIFIMRKEIFSEYCEWLFDILEEFEKRADMSFYSVEGYRTPGHLGERLFGIYYTWMKRQESMKTHELQLVFFTNTDKQEEITPAFEHNNVPIAMVSNDYYAPFYATMLQSLINNSSKNYNYDLIFLQRDFLPKTKKLLEKMIRDHKNFSVRFCQVSQFFSGSQLNSSPTIGVETYYKLAIPEILKAYPKVLYLDGDMIIKADVAELFKTDISDYLLGAVIDIASAGVANGFDKERAKYVKKQMRLKKIYQQFNAGVLLINNVKMREQFTLRYLLKFAEGAAFQFQDQDALNVLCEDQVLWLNQSWNFMGDEIQGYRGGIETFAPRDLYIAYREASKNPKIIHYAGNEKPWLFPKQEWAEEFWEVFMQTPFCYAFITQRMFDVSSYICEMQVDQGLLSTAKCFQMKKIVRHLADIVIPLGTARREIVKGTYKRVRKVLKR